MPHAPQGSPCSREHSRIETERDDTEATLRGVHVVTTAQEEPSKGTRPLTQSSEICKRCRCQWRWYHVLLLCFTVLILIALLLLVVTVAITCKVHVKNKEQKQEHLKFDEVINNIDVMSIRSPLPSAHLLALWEHTGPGTYTTNWDCNFTIHGESFLLGGMRCEDDMRKVTVPLDGIYRVYARITLACKTNFEQSATLVVNSDSYRLPQNLSTVIVHKCEYDSRKTVALIFGMFELRANNRLSLALSDPSLLRFGYEYTSLDVYMVSNKIQTNII